MIQSETPSETRKETPDKKVVHNNNKNLDEIIKYSFYITFVFLTTTGIITFIEAMRTNEPYIRHLFNLETCISMIASFFYFSFISKIDESDKKNQPIDWNEITLLRYSDWSITTPFMLLSLIMFLSYNVKIPIKLSIVLIIWLLNYIMLFIGFLGEINYIDRLTACFTGFIPFFIMIFIIYINFLKPKYNLPNMILFFVYLTVWSLYGIVYLFSEEYKNIITNILDLIAKCLVGIGMWLYYIKVLR